jgi:hypothetical protein
VVLVLLVPHPASSQLDLKTVETEHMRLIYYDEGHEYVIPHLARCFENSIGFHMDKFDWTPSEKVTVILRDLNDHGYAGATSLPVNYLIIGIEPYEQVYETSPTNERLNWVMSHELLHVVASDQATSSDRFYRKLFFGKVMTEPEMPISMIYSYMTSPRMYAPRWYHEGMAVFMETWMAGGYGRVLGGYDEMVFRTKVAEDGFFWDVVGLESEGTTTDFQVGQVSYLYGTRFVSYLVYHYGPDKLLRWLNRTDGSKRNFGRQFKHVYGRDLDEEWAMWIGWEHEWQHMALDSVRQYPTTAYRGLSDRALGSVSRTHFDPRNRELYSAVLYPGEVSHIVAVDVDTWQSRKVVEIPTPALYYVSSLAYDDSSETIFYTTDNSKHWRDLNSVNVKTKKAKRLMQDIRTGDLAFNKTDGSVWGIRHHNGLSSVVMIPPPYDKDAYVILTLPYGRDLFDIDLSPDGQYLTGTLIEVSGRQRLIRMKIDDLILGESIFEVLHEFPNYSPANFVFSPDGKYLFGTTYSTGVSNITRFDLEDRKMEWITNGETGYFRPVPITEDSLIALRYTSDGFKPVMVANKPIEDVSAVRFLGQAIIEKYPELQDWMLPPPSKVAIDSAALVPRDYSGWKSVRLGWVYPIVEDYKSRVAWGVRANLMDPMWLHGIDLTVSYTPNESLPSNERTHVKLKYGHYPWELFGVLNPADFYDFFGPTKYARKGYGVGGNYSGVLISDRPRKLDYAVHAAWYGDLETLPQYQNILVSFEEYLTFGAGLTFKSFRKTIGAVEDEKGIAWTLDVADNYVNKHHIPRYWGTLDYGFLLPLDHSSIWLRSGLGKSHGDVDEPFANYFFGAFGNNWVDFREEKRYREYYTYPGVEINEVGGTTFGKFMVEWTLPPARFRRAGIPSLYCNWAHLRLFATALSTNFHDRPTRRTLLNLGAQIDFKLVIFSTMSSTFSLGYAGAWEKDNRYRNEFMISLKIL